MKKQSKKEGLEKENETTYRNKNNNATIRVLQFKNLGIFYLFWICCDKEKEEELFINYKILIY